MNSIYLLVIISLSMFVLMLALGSRLSKLKANVFFIGIFATIIGLLIGTLAYLPLSKLPGVFGTWIPIVFYLMSVLVSIWLFLVRRKTIEQTFETIGKVFSMIAHLREQIPTRSTVPIEKTDKGSEKEIIVDTSVLIDGRIADIAKTGFIPGKLIIPRFMIAELQNIADSDDPMRRSKGRRGLDVVSELKKELKGRIESISDDFKDIKAVDEKLAHLAKIRGGELLTNDYNLNKVANIEGVRVLNINELSHALRPIIIPGEQMDIKIVQAGKERNQGVGYLEDGTMIVVEEGDRLVGDTVKVEIKRVLQTAAGKMYFATLKKS